MSNHALDVVLVGGGMITHDQILPSLYHLQRQGRLGAIKICALDSAPLRALADEPVFAEAFPGQSFEAFPSLDTPETEKFPKLYRELIAALPPRNLVVVALPDHMHDPAIRFALEHDQHVLVVKPLVLRYDQAVAIERLAHRRGVFVGIEYHKRFDRRSLEARRHYRSGRLGEFRCGEAKMIEPYYYRHSNFQNWFTRENTDPMTYVGCHYVDLVYFVTGLRPTEVAVRGIEGAFPNGKVGFLWASGMVTWENGAILTVITGLGYPDEAPGTNDQAICLYGEGPENGTIIKHNDQFRGCSYGYTDRTAGAAFRFINPDYFRLVPWPGEGLRPVGYGYDSIEGLVQSAADVNAAGDRLPARQAVLDEIDARGIIATPKNSSINELVIEATRLSILADGRPAVIEYDPTPQARLR